MRKWTEIKFMKSLKIDLDLSRLISIDFDWFRFNKFNHKADYDNLGLGKRSALHCRLKTGMAQKVMLNNENGILWICRYLRVNDVLIGIIHLLVRSLGSYSCNCCNTVEIGEEILGHRRCATAVNLVYDIIGNLVIGTNSGFLGISRESVGLS